MVDYRRLGSYWWIWLAGSIVLLGSVLLFGTNVRGTTGWFIIGAFSIQPVEVVKIAMVLVVAYLLAQDTQPSLKTWAGSFLALVPVFLLLFLQPDFGPIMMLFVVWLLLNALRGLSKKGWLVLIIGMVLVLTVGWFGILSDHQKGRISTFLNPSQDPSGKGFQIQQSIIAIGSGGLTGKGLGEGVQSQLHFLPEAPTDFVFASLLEQLGFVGFVILLALWILFFWRVIRIIKRSKDPFTLYLSVGLGLLIFIQTVVNVGMNMGLAPIVGLPLPFLSYGGSALLASFMLVGVLESIAIRQKI